MKLQLKGDVKYFKNGAMRVVSDLSAGLSDITRDALEDLKDIILDEPPSCPVLTGWMYDHHVITPNWRRRLLVSASIRVKDTPYAASQHEGISRWGTPYRKYTRPGSGPKWIESKLMRYGVRVRRNVTKGINRRIK